MAIVPSFIPNGDKINNAVSKFLDGGSVGIETLRSINYNAQYLWTVNFIGDNGFGPPKPFDDFFPASDISFPSAISNNHVFEMAQSSFSVPKNSSMRSIDMTFYDDELMSLRKWMTDWIELDIYNNGEYVSGINDSHKIIVKDSFNNSTRSVAPTRHIRIAFLDRFKSEALVYNYRIIPNGEVNITGSQNSDATVFNMKFDIVEEIGRPKNGDTQTFGLVKSVLGRFI